MATLSVAHEKISAATVEDVERAKQIGLAL